MKFLSGPEFDAKNRMFAQYSLSTNYVCAFTTESVYVRTLKFSSPEASIEAELSLGGLAQEEEPRLGANGLSAKASF